MSNAMTRKTVGLRWWGHSGSGLVSGARSRSRNRHRLLPVLLALEERRLLSTYTVDRISDTGTGSGLTGDLRYCISQANAANSASIIQFSTSLFDKPQTIT